MVQLFVETSTTKITIKEFESKCEPCTGRIVSSYQSFVDARIINTGRWRLALHRLLTHHRKFFRLSLLRFSLETDVIVTHNSASI